MKPRSCSNVIEPSQENYYVRVLWRDQANKEAESLFQEINIINVEGSGEITANSAFENLFRIRES